MIEKLVLGGIWTKDIPIFIPDALTSAPYLFSEYHISRLNTPVIFHKLGYSLTHMSALGWHSLHYDKDKFQHHENVKDIMIWR